MWAITVGGNSWAEKNVNINRKHSREQRDGKESMPFLQMKNAFIFIVIFVFFFFLPTPPSPPTNKKCKVKLIFGPKTWFCFTIASGKSWYIYVV